MRSIEIQSMGQRVAVTGIEMTELHAEGLSFRAYENLRVTRTHSQALIASRTEV